MKSKLISLVVLGALSCGAAQAVTVTTTLIANAANNVGLITTTAGDGLLKNATGTAFIYSTSVELSASQFSAVQTRLAFEAFIVSDPGVVRSNIAFTNGAVTSGGNTEMGAAGNKTYVWMESNTGGAASYGLFQGPVVPGLGAVTLNSATMTEDLIGTSTYSATGTSGFQLASIPEPSAALLGVIGALGLLRRRRI